MQSNQSNKFEMRAPPRRRVKNEDSEDQPLFLRKAYAMITSCPDEIGGWGSNGDTLIIKDVKEFSDKIIPTAYKHNNFSSFVRQLNFYGFRKIKSDSINHPDWWEFRHPHFIKGEPQLLSDIKRSVHFAESSNVQEVSQLKHQVTDLNDRIAALYEQIDKLTDIVTDMKVKDDSNISENNNLNSKVNIQYQENDNDLCQVNHSIINIPDQSNKKRKIKKESELNTSSSFIRSTSADSTIMIEDFQSNGEILATGPDLNLIINNNSNFFNIQAHNKVDNDDKVIDSNEESFMQVLTLHDGDDDDSIMEDTSTEFIQEISSTTIDKEFLIDDDIFDLFKDDNINDTKCTSKTTSTHRINNECNNTTTTPVMLLPYANPITESNIITSTASSIPHSNSSSTAAIATVAGNDLSSVLDSLPDELKLRFVDKLAEFMATQLSKNLNLNTELIEASVIKDNAEQVNKCNKYHLNNHNQHYKQDLNNYVLPSGSKAPEIAIPLATAAITAMLSNIHQIQNLKSITIKEEII